MQIRTQGREGGSGEAEEAGHILEEGNCALLPTGHPGTPILSLLAQLPGSKWEICAGHGAPCFYFLPSLSHFVFCKNLILTSPDAIFLIFSIDSLRKQSNRRAVDLFNGKDKKAFNG